VDTNVLVYANVARAPLHAEALTALRAYYQAGATLCTSRQVLREYLAVLSRPQSFTSPKPVATLIERVRYFESRFSVLEDSPQVTVHLLLLLEQLSIGGKQVHDANIVATMRAYGIGRLLTANVGDFVRFAHLITLLPLEAVA
jgi:predicted nucleic acid-binding protein